MTNNQILEGLVWAASTVQITGMSNTRPPTSKPFKPPQIGPRIREIPEGDNRPRLICPECAYIQYDNPLVVVGAVVTYQDRILLCRRAIEPRRGYWTLPAGFLENDESTEAGAARESREEACIEVAIDGLFTVFSVPHINQVHMIYRARLASPHYAPGPESLEVRLAAEQDIPWSELAFRTVERSLRLYFEDRRRGSFGVHSGIVERPPASPT